MFRQKLHNFWFFSRNAINLIRGRFLQHLLLSKVELSSVVQNKTDVIFIPLVEKRISFLWGSRCFAINVSYLKI